MSSFLGRERSGCALQIYGFAKRGLSFYTRGIGDGRATSLDFGAPPPGGAELITLSSVTSMGSGSGFQALLKIPSDFDPLESIELGSWVYVTYFRLGTPYLVMAGRITHRGIQHISSGGVTTRTCNIVGGGFELIWKKTKWYFNVLSTLGPEIETNDLLRSVGTEYLLDNPAKNVENIYFKFLAIMAAKGRAPYQFPTTMPGVSENAIKEIIFDSSGYDAKTLPVVQPIASGNYPSVDLWSMAQEYQDGYFTECWPDILPLGGISAYRANPSQQQGITPATAQMTIMFRDKPFPLVSSGLGTRRGRLSPYFSLPTHTLRRGDIIAMQLAGSDEEVFNAFSFATMGSQEGARGFIEMQYPNWNTSAQPIHGLQKLDAPSMYYAMNQSVQADYNRKRLRDWYCLGEELVSGSLQLGHGAPEIRVGSRVVIDATVPTERWTFYVESVQHSWTAAGLSTALTVTRGYRGTDAQHLARLESEVLNYDNAF